MLEYVKCHICGSSDYKIINKCRIADEDAEVPVGQECLSLVKCKACGLVFVNPQPLFSAEELERLYAKEYFNKDYMKFYGEEKPGALQSNEPFSHRLDLIEKYKEKGKLLDIGCATGAFLRLAKEKGWETYGVEVSAYAAEIAGKKYNLNVFKGKLEDAGFQDSYFDAVSASDILEHINNPADFLKKIRRILKEDGILYIAVPNCASFYFRFFGLISRFNQKNYFVLPHHLYHFSPKTIRSLLGNAGFEIADLRFSHSRAKPLFMNIFNFHDRLLAIARKKR